MKPTAQTNKIGLWFKPAILVACVAVLSMLVTACGKNENNQPASVPGTGYYGAYPGMPPCPTCAGTGNMSFLTNALARGQGGEMALDMMGDPMIIQQIRQANQMGAQMNYQGSVGANGYMILAFPACGLPPGRYMLQTMQPGIFGADGAGRSVDGLILMATGPFQGQVVLSGFTQPVSPPIAGQDGRTYPNRFVVAGAAINGCNITAALQ